MTYKRSDFVQFSPDADRTVANLTTAYENWVDAQRDLGLMPSSLYWQAKGSAEYLAIKDRPNSPGTTIGGRSPETEAQLSEHQRTKDALKTRIHQADELIGQRAALCRALRIPAIPDRQAGILRELDKRELLGNDVMVVGTNAFIAYSIACNARFPTGIEETEDFDLAWCRDSNVSLAHLQGKSVYRPTVMAALRGLEQEWLLQGRSISIVAPTVRGRACPLYVPDPRWMALHKLWLSQKPERNPSKKPKDARQGDFLLSACRYFLADTYPMDLDFVFNLPPELRDIFSAWAEAGGFDPTDPSA